MNRGVRQLTHLFVNYHPGGAASRTVEEFVHSPLLAQLKEGLPGVVIEPVVNKKTKPHLQAAYVNNYGTTLSLADCTTTKSVLAHCQRLADQKGRAPGHQGSIKRKPFAITQTPSVQGAWNELFNLKSPAQQLAPLQQTQTHLLGLAPPLDKPAQ